MNEKPIIPPRFEDEFPEEAEVLMKLCGNKELRERTQWQQAKYPKSERIYPHIDDLKLGILGWKYMMFKPKDKSSYKKSIPKVKRNDPCPCGSGKKFKKCCIYA